MSSIKVELLRRDLSELPIFRIELCAQLAALAVGVAMALQMNGAWPLIVMSIVAPLVSVALGRIVLGEPRGRFQIDRQVVNDLMKVGRPIFLSTVLGFIALNMDRVLLPFVVNANDVGVFSIAASLISVGTLIIIMFAHRVAFPTFCDVWRSRPTELCKALYKLRTPVDVVIGIAAGLLFIAGAEIVNLVYDARYEVAGRIFEILAIGMYLYKFRVSERCVVATGGHHLHSYSMAIKSVSLVISLLVGFRLDGLIGAVWAIALHELANASFLLLVLRQLKLLNLRLELLLLLPLPIGMALGAILEKLLSYA
jgi:O-antigen/teichoic acid export membrane protein